MAAANNDKKEVHIKLSIQVSLNGLSFCALDIPAKKIIFFKNLPFFKRLTPAETLKKIEKLYASEDFLQKEISQVEILFSNELYCIVPKPLYIEENASDYLKFNTKILGTDFVSQDYLSENDLVNVYIPYSNIINYFFDQYGEFQYRHCASILIDEFLRLNKDQLDQTNIYLNNHPWGYDLIVIQNEKLLFSNSFPCETKEDFIYYLLFTAEQLNLDPSVFKLELLGHIAKDSDYYKMAYTYIRNISFLETSFGLEFAIPQRVPKGYEHFTLLKSLL